MNPLRTWRWPLAEPAYRDLVRDLALRYHKWDATVNDRCRILPESIVLDRPTHARLVQAAESFAAAIRRFEARTWREPDVAERLGLDSALRPLLTASSPRESAFCRADFFRTRDGAWRISEFNEDVPGGFNEAVGVAELVDETTLGGRAEGALKQQLTDAFDDCDRIGLVFATAFSEDLQHCALLARWLEEAGHDTVLASPEQLRWRRGPSLDNRSVDGVFRFFPGESMAFLTNRETWVRALPRLRLMNPPLRLLAQSKRSFALWLADETAEQADRALFREWLPHTECYDPVREADVCAERERWVLKRAFGRMGDAVLMGALAKPDTWAAALAVARVCPDEFALQERFDVAPLPFEAGVMYPTIGVYTVNGRFAGYYSRVAPQPFITSEAYHVATVVETA